MLSKIRGAIHVSNGVAVISKTEFQVPGANADASGTYSLLNHRVDLHGTMDTRGSLADVTTGCKALVVKALTPIFKKRGPAVRPRT